MSRGYLAGLFPAPDGEYSDLQVCSSNAGFYIGTTFHNEGGFDEPGSRESEEYWNTRQTAERHLRVGTWTQRQNP